MQIRVGQGIDVHPFSEEPGRPLVLGGIVFEGEGGLSGHSDADVVAHACADALLGAAGLGDLGEHFPSTDDRWAGASSMALLAEVVGQVASAGWQVANVDCTVVCRRPRLAGRRSELQSSLSAVVGGPVSVKATTTDGLGALGRAEGIGCLSVALLVGTRP